MIMCFGVCHEMEAKVDASVDYLFHNMQNKQPKAIKNKNHKL